MVKKMHILLLSLTIAVDYIFICTKFIHVISRELVVKHSPVHFCLHKYKNTIWQLKNFEKMRRRNKECGVLASEIAWIQNLTSLTWTRAVSCYRFTSKDPSISHSKKKTEKKFSFHVWWHSKGISLWVCIKGQCTVIARSQILWMPFSLSQKSGHIPLEKKRARPPQPSLMVQSILSRRPNPAPRSSLWPQESLWLHLVPGSRSPD